MKYIIKYSYDELDKDPRYVNFLDAKHRILSSVPNFSWSARQGPNWLHLSQARTIIRYCKLRFGSEGLFKII